MRLFRWFILRRLVLEPLRSATTVLGIALGVGVIVAIQLANASSLAGFESAVDAVSGRASLQVVGTGIGVDERRLLDLGWLREYGDVSPVVEGDVTVRDAATAPERLRVLGVDVLREAPFRDYALVAEPERMAGRRAQELLDLLVDPQSAVLAATFAEPRGLHVGSTFTVEVGDRRVRLTVAGLLGDQGPARALGGRFMLMDLAGAQSLLDRFGRVDYIDVRVFDEAALAPAQISIAARLPDGLTVQRPARRGEQVEQMLAAFHLNLTALSYVALLVGLFLVYNTVSVAVLSRRDEIGTLRALGATRGGVRALFLAEAGVLALCGAGLGTLVGRVLADGAVALSATAVTAIYVATAAAPPALEWRHVFIGLASALPLALLAAVVPAQEAASVPPIAALRDTADADARAAWPLRRLVVATALLAVAAWCATRGPVGGAPFFGYASALAVVLGVSFLVPAVLTLVARTLLPVTKRWLRVEDWLAVANLSAAVPRLSISVAALAVSLSMMAAIAIMIGSFRETVSYWIGQTLQADLFVSPGARQRPDVADTLSPDLVQTITASPDVAAVDRYRATEVSYGDTRVRVGGGDFSVLLSHGSLLFKAPPDARARMREAIGQDAAVVSEAFALKHGRGAGDEIALPTEHGPARFRIAAVYFDYSNDRGVVMMDRPVFERHYDDQTVGGATVYLRDGVDPEAARSRLLAAIGDRHNVVIATNRALRAEVLRIFDSTFAITWALELIAIAVAILGISGTLLTLVIERERDISILRLIGTGRWQVRRMVIGEAVVLGAISQGIGLVMGFALSLLLVYVINVQSFGWTIQYRLPIGFLLTSSLLMIVAAALAGLYPAHRAGRLAMAPHEEGA